MTVSRVCGIELFSDHNAWAARRRWQGLPDPVFSLKWRSFAHDSAKEAAMHPRDLAQILVKIGGLIFIAHGLIGLPSTVLTVIGRLSRWGQSVPGFPGTTTELELWALGVVPISYFAVGFGLLCGAGWIVDRIVDQRRGELAFQSGSQAWEETAVAVLGLYFFVEGIFGVVRLAVAALTYRSYVMDFGVGTVLKLGFGIILMLRARGVVALRRRLIAFRDRTKADVA
jgi:hypothetical protein